MSNREAWQRALPDIRQLVLPAPAAAVVQMARRVIAEQDAEIARLRAELDGYQGRTVLHCTEAQMDCAASVSADEPDGTILRATDTGRELVLRDHAWVAR